MANIALSGAKASVRRRLFKLTMAASLVLCAGVAILSPLLLTISFWRHDRCALSVRGQHSAWLVQALSSRGGLGVDINHWFDLAPNPREQRASVSWTREPVSPYPDWASPGAPACNCYFAGFQIRIDDEYAGSRSVSVTIPEAALLVSIVPLWWAGRRAMIRRTRAARRCCVSCGYDLRATPDRCPECGAVSQRPSKSPHNPPLERTVPAV